MSKATQPTLTAQEDQTRALFYADEYDEEAGASEFRRSLALVVGIDDYRHGIPPLRTAANDARRLACILESDHGYQVHLLVEDVTLARLKGALEEIQVDADDRLLFYFAGHGVALDGDDGPAGYLVPGDARPEDRDTLLSMHELHQALAALPCRHLVAILDCCFAGAFRWSSTRALPAVPEVIHRERYERFIRDPAWQAITSAAYDQKALDILSGDPLGDRGDALAGEHSPFALALFEALRGAGDVVPKGVGDGVITATELYLYLRDSVEIKAEAQARHRQTPGLWPLRKHDKGEYIFLVPGGELNLPPAPDLTAENNPYRGLNPYEEEHSRLFFGRGALIEELGEMVAGQPLTVVLGASGTGKSSLVKAGLLPYLRRQAGKVASSRVASSRVASSRAAALMKHLGEEGTALPLRPVLSEVEGATEGGEWEILPPLRPGASPLSALANLLKAHLPGPGGPVRVAALRSDAEALADRVASWCQANPGQKVLLAIDQLEELITLCPVERERAAFLNLVSRAIEAQPDHLRVVLTLRSDFEPPFATSVLARHWSAARFVVTPMNQDELRDVIEGPASARVLYFNPYELVEDLINEVVQTPGALPLLSFTLSELYIKYLESGREDRALTREDYEALGGVVGALRNRATEEYEALDADHRDTMRRIMLRMITIEGGELARRRVPRPELVYADEAENGRVGAVIERLVAARLVVEGREEDGEAYVEPAHDALVRAWDRLLVWKQEAEEYLPLQRRLAQAARDWDRASSEKTKRGLLWNNDPRLPQLQQALEGDPRAQNGAGPLRRAVRILRLSDVAPGRAHWLNRTETRFVQESIRQRAKNLRRLIATILVVFVALSVLTLIAFDQRNQFQTESNLRATEIQVRKTAEANAIAEGDQRATQQKIAEVALAESQARGTAVAQERDRVEGLRLAALADGVLGENGNAETAALLAIRSLNTTYSPQAEAALVQALDRLHTWQIFPASNYSAVSGVAFSPDGDQVLVGSEGAARLLDVETGAEEAVFPSLAGAVTSVAFSPDGRYVLAGTGGSYLDVDYSVRVWDVVTGEELTAFFGHQATVGQAGISPDGRYALTGSSQEIVLWELGTGVEIFKFPGSLGMYSVELGYSLPGTRATFSPDGSQLLIAAPQEARLWDIGTRADVRSFPGSGGIFSPDGRGVITYASDPEAGLIAQIFDRDTGEVGRSVSIPSAGSVPVQVSPGGEFVLTLDGSQAAVWDLNTGERVRLLSGHTGDLTGAAFSPDGRDVLTGSVDGSARLWTIFDEDNPPTGYAVHRFSNDGSAVTGVAFSPDGAWLLTGDVDGRAGLWDVMTGQAARVYASEAYQVTAVAFSPGGHHLLAAGITAFEDDLVESALRVWDADTGELRQALEGLRGEIRGAVFSPDGSRILTGSTSGAAQLWDVETGQEVATLYAGGAEQVTSVAFSRDGTRVLVAANGNMFDDGFPYTHASLLDAESGEVLQVFSGGGDILRGVAIAPDGSQVLIGSENGRAWLSVVEPGLPDREEEITHIFSEHSEGVTSVAFSPDGRYALTGGQDGTARLWDTGTGEQVRVFSGHSAAVTSVAFSSDGRYALTGSSDGTARLWDVDYRDLVRFACSRVFRDFTVGQGDFRQTGNEWNLYAIPEGTPTCPRFGGS